MVEDPSNWSLDASPTNVHRTLSVRTQTSMRSTVSRIFRRARESISSKHRGDFDDQSIASASSYSQPNYPAASTSTSIKREPSLHSFGGNQTWEIPSDLRSISSRRSGRSATNQVDFTGRSRRTRYNSEEPPSSFKPLATTSTTGADNQLRTAKEIRAEIRAMEAGRQKLRYAFEALKGSAIGPCLGDGNMQVSKSASSTSHRITLLIVTLGGCILW